MNTEQQPLFSCTCGIKFKTFSELAAHRRRIHMFFNSQTNMSNVEASASAVESSTANSGQNSNESNENGLNSTGADGYWQNSSENEEDNDNASQLATEEISQSGGEIEDVEIITISGDEYTSDEDDNHQQSNNERRQPPSGNFGRPCEIIYQPICGNINCWRNWSCLEHPIVID